MFLKNRATTTSQCVAMHHATSNALIAGLAVMDRYPIYFSHKLLDLLVFSVFTLDANPHIWKRTACFEACVALEEVSENTRKNSQFYFEIKATLENF